MDNAAEVIKVEENKIVEFNKFEKDLADFKAKYDNVVYDLDDPAQDKQARSDRLSIGKVVATLDRTHKELKAPLKAKTDLIDAERKRIKDDLLCVQDKIKGQIAEHERKIQEHAEMLQQKVDNIESLGVPSEFEPVTSEAINHRIDKLSAIDVDDSFEHRKADATLAKIDAMKQLEALLDIAEKHEAEQAELERLRQEAAKREQEDRERKIAEEASREAEARALAAEQAAKRAELDKKESEERAKRLAAQAEQERKDAAAKAIKDKEEAIKREQQAAEQREQARIAAEQAAKEAEEAELLRRENDKKHRGAINKAALQSFVEGGLTEIAAKKAVELIAKKQIANVTISY